MATMLCRLLLLLALCIVSVSADGIDDEMNPLLLNNDIIVVRRSGSARISDTLDTIARPLTSAFSIFALPSTILRLFD